MFDFDFTPAAIAGAIIGAIVGGGAVLTVAYKIRGNTPCPNCGEKLPALRLPRNARQFMWGGSSCPKCGQEFDRFGEGRKT